MDAIADGVYQKMADHNQVADVFADGLKYGAGVGTGFATGNPVVGAGVSQGSGYAIDAVFDRWVRMTEEEAEAEIAKLAQGQAEDTDELMRSPATIDNIEEILRDNSDLNDENIQTLLDDYYDYYWNGVKHHHSLRPG